MRTSRFPAAQQCTATTRAGAPCRRWALRGSSVCVVHGGHLPNVQAAAQRNVDSARDELLGLAGQAVEVIRAGLSDPDPNTRRHYAREVLSRAVPPPRPGTQVTLEVEIGSGEPSAGQIVRDRLDAKRVQLQAYFADHPELRPPPPERWAPAPPPDSAEGGRVHGGAGGQ